jgi:ABC-type transport system substrate-binding protein
MTRSTRLLLATAFAGALAAAADPTLAQSPRRGGVFRLPAPDAVSLDPHLNAGFTGQMYASLVYSHLVRFPAGPEATGSGDHRILPDLAEKWESPTPTTVVFTLRKGVRFHRKPPVDGREVTAEDYYVYLPMWPRYIAHPPYVKGFKHIDRYGLGTRLMYVWLDR